MTTDTAAGRPQRHFHLNMQAFGIFAAAAAIFVIFGVLNSNFLTVGNLRDIAVSACVNALIGLGLTFVIIPAASTCPSGRSPAPSASSRPT